MREKETKKRKYKMKPDGDKFCTQEEKASLLMHFRRKRDCVHVFMHTYIYGRKIHFSV